jgi:hypothetical protein
MIYLYELLQNDVATMEKVHYDGRMAAKTPLLIYYAKLNGCILWIHPS